MHHQHDDIGEHWECQLIVDIDASIHGLHLIPTLDLSNV